MDIANTTCRSLLVPRIGETPPSELARGMPETAAAANETETCATAAVETDTVSSLFNPGEY